MDRLTDEQLKDTSTEVVAYIEYLEQKVEELEQGIQTAASIRDSWEAAYHEQEGKARQEQQRADQTMLQARGMALSLERTEKNLRTAHMQEGVLAALLEQERGRVKALTDKAQGVGKEP